MRVVGGRNVEEVRRKGFGSITKAPVTPCFVLHQSERTGKGGW